jgi:hypothetical protein
MVLGHVGKDRDDFVLIDVLQKSASFPFTRQVIFRFRHIRKSGTITSRAASAYAVLRRFGYFDLTKS